MSVLISELCICSSQIYIYARSTYCVSDRVLCGTGPGVTEGACCDRALGEDAIKVGADGWSLASRATMLPRSKSAWHPSNIPK